MSLNFSSESRSRSPVTTKKDVRVEDDDGGHGSRLVQEAVHEGFAGVFIQRIPIEAPLARPLAELIFGEGHALLAALTRLLREGKQGLLLGVGRQFPHQGDYLFVS